MAYVPQGNTLFSGTIAEYLRFGAPEATEEQLIVAVKAACAWGFIELTEGQVQRLAIALLQKALIIIFDEATFALASEMEIKIL